MSDTPVSGNPTKVTVGSTTTLALATNAKRRYAIFINDSDEDMYLSTNGTAVMNEGERINKEGGSFEMLKGKNMVTGNIAVICSSGSKNLCVDYW